MKRTRGKKGRIQGRITPHKALAEVRELLGDAPRSRDLLVEHLHRLQDHYGHLSHRHLLALTIEMELPMAEVFETATFYHHFDVLKADDAPPPELTVRVCESLTCEMFGAAGLIEQLRATTDAGKVRIQPVPCVGRCQAAPVAVVGTNPVEQARPETVAAAVKNGETSCPEPDAMRYARYREEGGYKLLADCVNGRYAPEQVIDVLEGAGLRGLGRRGFPGGPEMAHPCAAGRNRAWSRSTSTRASRGRSRTVITWNATRTVSSKGHWSRPGPSRRRQSISTCAMNTRAAAPCWRRNWRRCNGTRPARCRRSTCAAAPALISAARNPPCLNP